MSEERLWKFRRPEWMNSANARSAGVYGAGALVCVMLVLRDSLVVPLLVFLDVEPSPSPSLIAGMRLPWQ